jgi:xanthine/uracil/vitamin C permease (AzgA family)
MQPDPQSEHQVLPRKSVTVQRQSKLEVFGQTMYNRTVGAEIVAGIVSFLVMSYIAFVNPKVVSSVPDGNGFRLDFGQQLLQPAGWQRFFVSSWASTPADRFSWLRVWAPTPS